MAVKKVPHLKVILVCVVTDGIVIGSLVTIYGLRALSILLFGADCAIFTALIAVGIVSFRSGMETRRWRKVVEVNNEIGRMMLKAMQNRISNDNDSEEPQDRPTVIN